MFANFTIKFNIKIVASRSNEVVIKKNSEKDTYDMIIYVKNDLINSLNKMEKSILSSNDTIKSVVNVYASFDPNKMNNSVEESIEMEENDLNRSRSFEDVLKYQNREKEQEEKIKRLNTKISDLENIQNKIYDLNSNNYKSIKSLGDGQILGIQNKGENEYTIYANNGCVGIDSSENVKMVSCGSGKRFNLHNISNEEEYMIF